MLIIEGYLVRSTGVVICINCLATTIPIKYMEKFFFFNKLIIVLYSFVMLTKSECNQQGNLLFLINYIECKDEQKIIYVCFYSIINISNTQSLTCCYINKRKQRLFNNHEN